MPPSVSPSCCWPGFWPAWSRVFYRSSTLCGKHALKGERSMRPAHTVPTHVGNMEDRLLFGLTVRLLLPLAAGAIGGAWLYQNVPLAVPERLALAALVLLLGVVLAALRPR